MSGNQSSFSLLGKIASYTEILAKDPHSTVFVSLSEAYRQVGLLDDALEVAQKGTTVLPGFGPGYTAMGRILAQQGKLEEAALAFEKALSLDQDSLAALKGLAKVRIKLGEKSHARRLLLRAAALEPADDTVRQWLDRLGPELVQPPPSSAQPELEKEPLPPPQRETGVADNDPISTATIAEIYVRQGFLKRAAKIYRDLLQVNPHNEGIREKLVALKRRILAEEENPGKTSAPDVLHGETPPAEIGNIASQPAEPLSKVEPVKNSEILAALEGWLDSIERRREHVQ
jgi:tetratricopeptide (TPR) repeat protein